MKRVIFFSLTLITLLFLPTNAAHSYYGEELLLEDFDDGDANDGDPLDWIETLGTQGSWVVTADKRYQGSSPRNSSTHSTSLGGDVMWKNYRYEVDVTGISGVDRHLMFRYDPSRGYSKTYSIKYRENNYGFPGHIALLKQNVGVLMQDNNFNSHIGETHKFVIDSVDENIKVYVDGNLIFNFTDTVNPLLSGQVGFFVEKPGFVHPTFNNTTITAYDNVKITSLETGGPLDLPFEYVGRGGDDENSFQNAFWDKTNSFFDHNPADGSFIPFTGEEYTAKCISGKSSPLECYNGHNGLDFSRRAGAEVLAAHEGKVVYASNTTPSKNKDNCISKKKGYGCIVILEHESGLHTLYAHMREIFAKDGNQVTSETVLGKMGATGNAKGVHLHFGALYKMPSVGLNSFKVMKRHDWEKLIQQLKISESKSEIVVIDNGESECIYPVNGLLFNVVDPSGWEGEGVDPWSEPAPNGCGAENNLLWKYPLN